MSDALRTIFAEFGFEVDTATLEKLDKRLKETIGTTKKAAKGTDDAAKSQKAKAEADKKAAAESKALGKQLSTYSGIVDHISSKAHERFGENLLKRFPQIGEAAKKYGVDAEGVGKVVVGATAAIVAGMALATRAAFQFADSFAAGAESLRDTARESRVTTTQIQELDHAAVQGGVGLERMRSGVATFGASLRSAERWGNGTTGMLRRLGIQARDSGGRIRPTGELMDEVAVAMEHIESPTRRARVAVQLFGESGRRMLDVLHTGPGGIRALRDELAELGGGVTPEAVEASRQYTQATEKLSRAQDSLRSVLAVSLLPALSWLVEKGAAVGGLMARLTNGTHVVQIALAGLALAAAAAAAPIIIAWAPVALPFVVMAAKVALAVAVLDDLITFVEGGDSAIGRLIDSLFGVGTATQYVHELKEEWETVVDVLSRVIEKVAWVIEHASPAALLDGLRPLIGQAPRRPAYDGEGTLRPPQLGPRRPTVSAIPTSAITVASVQAVPTMRTVAAPGSVVHRTRVTQISRTIAPVFHLSGADPRATAAEAVRLMQQAERDRRDGDHPVEDDDDDGALASAGGA